MKRVLILILAALLLAFTLAACGPTEAALPTPAVPAEIAPSPETQPTDAPPVTDSMETETAVPIPGPNDENEERPFLPTLNEPPANQSGQPLPDDPWQTAVFTLNAILPTTPNEAQVWRWTAGPVGAARAQTIAQRWGFDGPLYTLSQPDEIFLGGTPAADAAPLPPVSNEYHAFDGPRSLVITEGAAYFADESLSFDYQSPPPYMQRAAETEAALQTLGLLDFPYTLQDGWGREVWVLRLLDEMAINLPEISAGVVNGRLAFATYQPYEQLTPLGRYPLISAADAWQQVQAGGKSVRYTLTPPTDAALTQTAPPADFQYWPRQHQAGQEVHFYAPPTVFTPISGEGSPLVKALNYTVQTDDQTRLTLAAQVGITLHFWGILDTAANSLALTGWQPVPDLNPLLKNGTVQRQGDMLILTEPGGDSFILPDAPADLEDGSQVNVFAWAVRQVGLAYPVLDWEGIDRQVAGVSGESLAQPDDGWQTPIQEITINQVVLSYYVHPDTDAASLTPLSYWLLPVWQFSGVADSGAVVTVYVQATDSGQ